MNAYQVMVVRHDIFVTPDEPKIGLVAYPMKRPMALDVANILNLRNAEMNFPNHFAVVPVPHVGEV
jgi:hypothetical protein